MRSSKNVLPQKSDLVLLYRQAVLEQVPLGVVDQRVREEATKVEAVTKQEKTFSADREAKIVKKVPTWMRIGAFIIPTLCISAGVFLVGSAVMPIAGYYVNELPELQANTLAAPIPAENVLDAMPLVVSQTGGDGGTDTQRLGTIEPVIIENQLDYTNLSNWFEGATLPDLSTQSVGAGPIATVTSNSDQPQIEETYVLEIPSINIKNATVTIGGTNLNKSLIQFPGTALPGQNGSPVIFGHSVLRQFYNPSEKNSRRYNSIFSTIMTLKKGEKIFLTYKGVTYTYIVQEKTEVKPTDTYILAQKYDGMQLKLVTCTPEGTYLRRGVVTATLLRN